jgi:hypothetical protein
MTKFPSTSTAATFSKKAWNGRTDSREKTELRMHVVTSLRLSTCMYVGSMAR